VPGSSPALGCCTVADGFLWICNEYSHHCRAYFFTCNGFLFGCHPSFRARDAFPLMCGRLRFPRKASELAIGGILASQHADLAARNRLLTTGARSLDRVETSHLAGARYMVACREELFAGCGKLLDHVGEAVDDSPP